MWQFSKCFPYINSFRRYTKGQDFGLLTSMLYPAAAQYRLCVILTVAAENLCINYARQIWVPSFPDSLLWQYTIYFYKVHFNLLGLQGNLADFLFANIFRSFISYPMQTFTFSCANTKWIFQSLPEIPNPSTYSMHESQKETFLLCNSHPTPRQGVPRDDRRRFQKWLEISGSGWLLCIILFKWSSLLLPVHVNFRGKGPNRLLIWHY